ncbi:MAG TPA: LytTR family transcriptional regulator DNA-binding domain-containing protein [Flavitalea sp.]|nr:LytTR family transcriptional regulator DNA-binding domain-containing protein [Flavitalea sp.]
MFLSKMLRQPFPYEGGLKNHLAIAAFFGLFIFVFLMIFAPFDLDRHPTRKLLAIALSYGLITTTCIFIMSSIFPLFFPAFFNESSWTTGKQILITAAIVFIVGLSNYLVSPFLVDTKWNVQSAVWFQGITLAISFLPVTVYILSKQNRLLRKFSQQAEKIDEKLQQSIEEKGKQEIEENVSHNIVLHGDYQDERIEVFADDLVLVSSASNYIKVFHLQKTSLVHSIIRSTLRKAEESLSTNPNFFKCHRAFIVNLDKVVHVEGNAQGYRIKIDGYDELIPVSRNLSSEFSDKLLAFRKRFT